MKYKVMWEQLVEADSAQAAAEAADAMQRQQGGTAKTFEVLDEAGAFVPVAIAAPPPPPAEEVALHDRYRRTAVSLYETDDLEFDDDATVSVGDDDGAFVQAWRWVADTDLLP